MAGGTQVGALETDTATPVRLPGVAVTGPGAEAGAWGWVVGTGLGVGPISARPGSGRGDLGLVQGGMCSLQVWCRGWSTASLLRDAVGRETELCLSREVPRCLQLATLRTGALRGQGPESQGSPLREGGA